MAYLVEQCGGKAFTGKERVLDVVPHDIHQVRLSCLLPAKGNRAYGSCIVWIVEIT